MEREREKKSNMGMCGKRSDVHRSEARGNLEVVFLLRFIFLHQIESLSTTGVTSAEAAEDDGIVEKKKKKGSCNSPYVL